MSKFFSEEVLGQDIHRSVTYIIYIRFVVTCPTFGTITFSVPSLGTRRRYVVTSSRTLLSKLTPQRPVNKWKNAESRKYSRASRNARLPVLCSHEWYSLTHCDVPPVVRVESVQMDCLKYLTEK